MLSFNLSKKEIEELMNPSNVSINLTYDNDKVDKFGEMPDLNKYRKIMSTQKITKCCRESNKEKILELSNNLDWNKLSGLEDISSNTDNLEKNKENLEFYNIFILELEVFAHNNMDSKLKFSLINNNLAINGLETKYNINNIMAAFEGLKNIMDEENARKTLLNIIVDKIRDLFN